MSQIATRRERVLLDLEDNLTPGLARAAVASRALRGELDGLGKSAPRAGDGIDKVGSSSNKAGPDIDRFSGRLKLLRDVAVLLGPAIVPLGAASIPLLTGSLVSLSAAAGGIGVTVLALQGVGDGLKALDAFQADRTPENLAKLREEFDKLGPSGENFVRFLDSIEPELKSLQTAARDGLLPGLEEGISTLLTELPAVRDLVGEVAQSLGGLASDAGADLVGPEWEGFFDYIRTDAVPTLEQFSRTVGNFAQGFGNLLVGLAPATRDFSGGLLELSERFADWSAGLEDNAAFQDFVDYVRQSGPQAVELLGAIAQALAGLAEAMAPYGSVVLPALTEITRLFAALAASDMGSVLVSAAAGLTLFNRAASLTTGSLTKMGTALASNPWGLAAAAITVAVTEVIGANDELVAATERAQDAFASGDTTQMQAALDDLNAKIEETKVNFYPEDTADSFAERVKEGIPVLGELGDALDTTGDLWTKFSGAEEDAVTQAEFLQSVLDGRGFFGQMQQVRDAADALLGYTGETEAATKATSRFEDSINHLNGVLDRRAAIRDYRDSIDAFLDALKKGESTPREMNALLDNIARSAGRAAEGLVGADKRRYMVKAKADFEDFATKLYGSEAAGKKLADRLFDLNKQDTKPKVDIDLDPLRRGIAQAESWLNGIKDETVNINVVRTGYAANAGTGRGPTRGDDPGRIAANFTPTDFASPMQSIRDQIRQELSGSLFGESGNVWAANGGMQDPSNVLAAQRDKAKRIIAAVQKLKAAGITGASLQAIIAEGLPALEYMASQPASELNVFTADFNATQALIAQASAYGAQSAYGQQSSAQSFETGMNQQIKLLRKDVQRLDVNNTLGHRGTQQAQAFGQKRVRAGYRRGKASA